MRDGHNRNPWQRSVTGCEENGSWKEALLMQPTITDSSALDGEDRGGSESRIT